VLLTGRPKLRSLASAWLLSLASCIAPPPLSERVPARGTFDEAVALIETELYDPTRLDAAWHGAVDTHRERWNRASNPQDRARELRSLLATLRLSHTALYTPDQPAWAELMDLFRAGPTRVAIGRYFSAGVVSYDTIGIVATELDGVHFVADVFDGSPAAKAGVLAGDRILAAADLPRTSEELEREDSRATERLLLQRAEGDDGDLVVDVVQVRVEPEELYLAAQRASARVVERAGQRVAYVHLRSWASPRFQSLLEEQLLRGPLADAEALVLDLRGGWGGANPDYLALFDPRMPELAMTPRRDPPEHIRSAWTKPVVLLVDGSTRSGKEVIAYAFKRHGIGPVVGERTAGAVLGGQPFVLRDGSLLMLATADVLVDGERLEGVGVEPDLAVPRELPYSAGRDPQLEAALDEAARLAAHASQPISPKSP
jgi:carboxyl-terminal processing protease